MIIDILNIYIYIYDAWIAQFVEHETGNLRVQTLPQGIGKHGRHPPS